MEQIAFSGDTLAHYLYEKVAALPLTVYPLYIPLARLTENRPYSNVYELISDSYICDAIDICLLQMSSEVADTASDYERFTALCGAVPQWAGHPVYAAIHGLLAKVLDCQLPLNIANAPEIWRIGAEKLSVEDLGIRNVLVRMGVETVYVPSYPRDCMDQSFSTDTDGISGLNVRPVLDSGLLTDIGNPFYVNFRDEKPCDLTAYTHSITAHLQQFAVKGGKETRATLPEDFHFVRPDPYHAEMVWKKVVERQAFSPEEANLLAVQTLRIWGKACVSAGLSLTICGGAINEVTALLVYLKDCNGLPSTTYIPDDLNRLGKTDVLALARHGISLGIAFSAHDTPGVLQSKLCSYAARIPLGNLARVELPIKTTTDVWTLIRARRVLCNLLGEWAEDGYAPRDADTLTNIAKIV